MNYFSKHEFVNSDFDLVLFFFDIEIITIVEI